MLLADHRAPLIDDMSNSLFVQISALLQKVRGPDGTPETEVFLTVCRQIIPVIGRRANSAGTLAALILS